jgi:hypothetical protein
MPASPATTVWTTSPVGWSGEPTNPPWSFAKLKSSWVTFWSDSVLAHPQLSQVCMHFGPGDLLVGYFAS